MKRGILLLILYGILTGGKYYVSPQGSDSNDGSYEHPWRTPGYGSKHISSGDTLIILEGDYILQTYWDDMVTPPSGRPGARTVIAGEGKVRLMGRGSLLACVQIVDGSHIEIRNLELTSLIDTPYSGGCREGIDATSDVSDLIFENLEIHRVEEMGINLGGDAEDVVIRNCNIHHCGYTGIGGPAGSKGGWVNVHIDSCYIGYCGRFYNGRDTVAWVWDRPDGIGMEESEGPLTVSYTTSEMNMGDGIDSKSKRTYIHHCIVANNYGDGIKLWGDSSIVENSLIYGTGAGIEDTTPWCLLIVDSDDADGYFEITNCTFWDSPERPPHYTSTIQYDHPDVPITLVMRNNIVSGNRRFFMRGSVNPVFENNLFYIMEDVQVTHGERDYTYDELSLLGEGNIYGDPLFVKVPDWGDRGDFHLQSSSPAVDGGRGVEIEDDLDLYPRPYNGYYDIGCYEWHPSSLDIGEGREGTLLFVRSVDIPIDGDVHLYSVDGRTIFEGKVERRLKLTLPSGVYFVKVRTEKGEESFEMVVID